MRRSAPKFRSHLDAMLDHQVSAGKRPTDAREWVDRGLRACLCHLSTLGNPAERTAALGLILFPPVTTLLKRAVVNKSRCAEPLREHLSLLIGRENPDWERSVRHVNKIATSPEKYTSQGKTHD